MCFTHVELALDPPPRFILQPAAAIELINLLPLGGEQQELNLVAKLDVLTVAVVAIASVLDVLEPITVIGADWLDNFLRESLFRRKLVEPCYRCLDRLSPSGVLLGSFRVAFSTSRRGKAERPDHPRQHQALTNQRHQDDRKSEEENQVAVGERLTVYSCKRDRERRRERDDAPAAEIQNLSKMFTDIAPESMSSAMVLGRYVQRVLAKASPVCVLLDRLGLGRFWILFAVWGSFW